MKTNRLLNVLGLSSFFYVLTLLPATIPVVSEIEILGSSIPSVHASQRSQAIRQTQHAMRTILISLRAALKKLKADRNFYAKKQGALTGKMLDSTGMSPDDRRALVNAAKAIGLQLFNLDNTIEKVEEAIKSFEKSTKELQKKLNGKKKNSNKVSPKDSKKKVSKRFHKNQTRTSSSADKKLEYKASSGNAAKYQDFQTRISALKIERPN